MIRLGIGGSEWVDQFLAGFPHIGPVSEEVAYSRKGDPSPRISRPEVLEGAPERCSVPISSRTSPCDARLWEEALAQQEEGWFEGPFAMSRDAILDRNGTETKCNAAFRSGAPQGEKFRVVDDPEQRWTNRAAQVLTPINLPSRNHPSSMIKLKRIMHFSIKLAITCLLLLSYLPKPSMIVCNAK